MSVRGAESTMPVDAAPEDFLRDSPRPPRRRSRIRFTMSLSRTQGAHAPIPGRGRLREGNDPVSLVLRPARGLEKRVHDRVLHTVMHENILANAARLSDDALHSRLKFLANRECSSTVELVGHLADLDGRKTRLGEGPGSLYTYCRDVLGYSEDAAWNRAATANAVRLYPVILGWLADWSLNVTTVRILRPVLTRENGADGGEAPEQEGSRSDQGAPRPEGRHPVDDPEGVRPRVRVAAAEWDASARRKQPHAGTVRRAAGSGSASPGDRAPHSGALSAAVHGLEGGPRQAATRAEPALPRDPQRRSRGHLRACARSHFARCREEEARRDHEAAATTRKQEWLARRPAYVRRAVWKRDGGQCAFNGRSGRCPERRFLEWHHVQPHGHQGPATVDNISLRCRAHNVYESELVFGRFDPSVVREAAEVYAVSREIEPFRNGASTNLSWVGASRMHA